MKSCMIRRKLCEHPSLLAFICIDSPSPKKKHLTISSYHIIPEHHLYLRYSPSVPVFAFHDLKT
ncbi:hypothetical protein L3Y34_011361 [Caenorhabditis briggsae]|uniref:Uncharacterized protein n=1 Tax=Caenorhabditis briggsae TaxID=6238 RepID=A0AAE8ZW66_CAEBR|nr:hypothetical protein L3Y34_011361 [Caenorhabditis briggsae]